MLDHLWIFLEYKHCDDRVEIPLRLANRKIIFLHRDPRDTVTSNWYSVRKRCEGFSGTFAEFLRDPEYGLERIISFNLFWIEYVSRTRRGLITSYETLQNDTYEELNRIVEFIKGRPVSPRQIDAAIEAGSFQNMRLIEASGEGSKLYGYALSPANPDDPESYKTRCGSRGHWRSHFDDSDIAYSEQLLEKHDYFRRMSGER